MEIFKVVSEQTAHGCDRNEYYFVGDNFWVKFFQGGNLDLMLYVNTFKEVRDKVSFSITKEEHPKVYKLISKMLDGIEDKKYIEFSDGKRKLTTEYSDLFKKGYFSWQSDAPANEDDYGKSKDFIYNYFSVISMDDEYRLEFINNIKKPYFVVEVNTDRSRYWSLRFDVWDFFNNLKDVCEEKTHDEFKEMAENIWKKLNTKKLLLVSHRYSEKEKKEIRRKEALIFRKCALRDIFDLNNFGVQLETTKGNIKLVDTHPREPKYKIYTGEEIGKRLYKKINEVKKD